MIGESLSHYRITAKLGEGGMGEVYLAEDTRLGRRVALKVLPAAVASNPERLARFEREARVLASLNHPNIAHLYGLEEIDGRRLLIMELVSGETLAERLRRGALPLDETIPLARQLADALEAAHECGVIHRDLKPANLMIAASGQLKVLDFGLAKALATDPDPGGESDGDLTSPTLTAQMTRPGALLGTAAYMSPEQVKGLVVDHRADIWAFGVVLWEMLTGRRLFGPESFSEVLAAVLREPIAAAALPAETPAELRAILTRCLDRDPRSRLRDIGEARVALTQLAEGRGGTSLLGTAVEPAIESTRAAGPLRLPWLLIFLAAAVVVALGTVWIRQRTSGDPPPIVAAVLPPTGWSFDGGDGLALSPDGRLLVIPARSRAGPTRLWVQPLDSPEGRFLEGTEGARYPFLSPDSRHLGYFADGSLKKVAAAGGPSRILGPASNPRGGTWCAGNTIVYAPDFSVGLVKVGADGGAATELTQLDSGRGERSHRLPWCLPSGSQVLMLSQTAEGGTRGDRSRIEQVDVETGERREILNANSSMAYAPSGHLLYWRDRMLLAVPFVPERPGGLGDPLLVARDVVYTGDEYAAFAISRTGLLAYTTVDPAGAPTRLVRVDVAGQPIGEPSPMAGHGYIAVSRSGRKVAYESTDHVSVWIRDLVRETTSPFSRQEGDHMTPVWSPDDEWLAYSTDRDRIWQIFRRRASGEGPEELLVESELSLFPGDWSPDGRYLTVDVSASSEEVHVALYDFEDRSLTTLVDSPLAERELGGRFSPDGRWLAFVSNETGRDEVHVVRLIAGGRRVQVSTQGGDHPRWGPDGGKLYYTGPDRGLFVVDVRLGAELEIGLPRRLFTISGGTTAGSPYAVLADGRSFLINQREESEVPDHLTLVQSWLARTPR